MYILDNGKTQLKMDMALRNFKMGICTLEIIFMANLKEMVNIDGSMDLCIRGNFWKA